MRVKVAVSSDDMEDTITSILNREFRTLDDVEISHTYPIWRISVIRIESQLTDGTATGNTFSVAATKAGSDKLVHHKLIWVILPV